MTSAGWEEWHFLPHNIEGGRFLGNPDGTTASPAAFEIDYVRACVLTGDHFHLLPETPDPNLVAGMESGVSPHGNSLTKWHIDDVFHLKTIRENSIK